MYEKEINEIETEIFVMARQFQNNLNMLNARLQDLKGKLAREESKEEKKGDKK